MILEVFIGAWLFFISLCATLFLIVMAVGCPERSHLDEVNDTK